MKKAIITTFAALIMAASQALPAADTFSAFTSDTAVTAHAADYTPAKINSLSAKASYTKVTLSWAEISGANGYRVYIYDAKTKKYKKLTTISGSSTASYKVTGLTPATGYRFKVRAYRKVNGKTYWGKTAAISVTTKSYTPAQVKGVSAEAFSDTAGALYWKKVANANGYRVYVYNTATKKYKKVATVSGGDNTNYDITGLTASTSYRYKVRAYRKAGGKTYWGKPSKAVTLTTYQEGNWAEVYDTDDWDLLDPSDWEVY